MVYRCIRCGKTLEGPGQLCAECAEQQRASQTFVDPAELQVRMAPETTGAARKCSFCGFEVPPAAMYCPSCGNRRAGEFLDYAGFWMRLLATLIDGIILIFPTVLLFLLVGDNVAYYLLSFAIGLAYNVGFWVTEGATPGKMAMGIKITMRDGRDITLWAALLRHVGIMLSNLILGIGHLLIVFNTEKRALQDFIAGTVVVRKG